jgi:hypothetical protein
LKSIPTSALKPPPMPTLEAPDPPPRADAGIGGMPKGIGGMPKGLPGEGGCCLIA